MEAKDKIKILLAQVRESARINPTRAFLTPHIDLFPTYFFSDGMLYPEEATECITTNDKISILSKFEEDGLIKDFEFSEVIAYFTIKDLDMDSDNNPYSSSKSDTVLKNISKFSIVDESQLALKVMSGDSDGTYFIIENFNKFKNLNKKVVSEIIKNESFIDDSFTLSEELNSNIKSFAKEAQAFIRETYPTV